MNTLRLIGGIISIFGAVCVIAPLLIIIFDIGLDTASLILMILPILVVIAGILSIMGKKAGGYIALIVGILWLVIAILLNLGIDPSFLIYISVLLSSFAEFLGFTIWGFLYVEILLVLVGGLLVVVSPSKD